LLATDPTIPCCNTLDPSPYRLPDFPLLPEYFGLRPPSLDKNNIVTEKRSDSSNRFLTVGNIVAKNKIPLSVRNRDYII
jgi:hypothetical protein